MHFSSKRRKSIKKRLEYLYGTEEAEIGIQRLDMMLGRYGIQPTDEGESALWSESDTLLITYADTIVGEGSPLEELTAFSKKHFKDSFSLIHLLPFYPFSSDDGFSVIDYRKVNPEVGGWSQILELGKDFDLMYDFVVNHVSRKSSWFRDFVGGVSPGREFFITENADTDVSAVTRPRAHPLLVPVHTKDGQKWVWATFSDDQIDVNFKEPNVLFEYLDILFYYIFKGARMLRIDAIAYLWKELGTNCIHLPQTHEVVKLIRDILDEVAPETIILTETNVPHQENVSYFGHGDEAHMVYQFSLPPLLLHALQTTNTSYLQKWAQSLSDLPENCTYLNFTASHDGIGVRPLQGLIPDQELNKIAQNVTKRGGKVSMKKNSDGSESPYELNITYFDALAEGKSENEDVMRFLCSQAVSLVLQGMPAIYIQSMLACKNWEEGYAETQRARTLNRRKWNISEIENVLENNNNMHHRVFQELNYLLSIRRKVKAFHPDAAQKIHESAPHIFIVERTEMDTSKTVLCIFNFSSESQEIDLNNLNLTTDTQTRTDMLSGRQFNHDAHEVLLGAYEFLWLKN